MYHKRFKGTHYEAGFKYGRMLKKYGFEIINSSPFTITEEMKRFTTECLPIYEAYYPEIIQEINGLADGQKTSADLFYQMLFSMYCFNPDQHCTCFAFSDSDNILLGRNSDFLVSLEKLYMNCLYNLEKSYAFNGNTTAFIEMEDGMNEYGLAVGLTFVYPKIHKPGLNAGMLLRYILEKCKTTEEAIKALKQLPIASTQTFTIADATGKIVVIECNPNAMEVIYPNNYDSFVATTNHFNTEALKVYNPSIDIDTWRSNERYETVKEALSSDKNIAILTFSKELLSGKYGFICQYDRKKNADTVWSVIYDVKNCKVYRVEGNPSRRDFKEDKRMNFEYRNNLEI